LAQRLRLHSIAIVAKGELPNVAQQQDWHNRITITRGAEQLVRFFTGFRRDAQWRWLAW
jgi:hypothetical protein